MNLVPVSDVDSEINLNVTAISPSGSLLSKCVLFRVYSAVNGILFFDRLQKSILSLSLTCSSLNANEVVLITVQMHI